MIKNNDTISFQIITLINVKMLIVFCINDLLETKNMIPAANDRLNRSKAEKWAKERIPAMMPAKHDMADRIIKARVAFQYAEEE